MRRERTAPISRVVDSETDRSDKAALKASNFHRVRRCWRAIIHAPLADN